MSSPDASPTEPTEPARDDAALALAATQLRELAELRQMAMDEVRAVKAAADRARAEGKMASAELAIARLAKAIRHIMMLEQELCGLREQRRTTIRTLLVRDKKADVREVLQRVIGQPAPRSRGALNYRIARAMSDYGDDDEYYRGTVGEIVAQICRDLGVTRDLSLWREPAPGQDPDPEPAPRETGEAAKAGKARSRLPSDWNPNEIVPTAETYERLRARFEALTAELPQSGCGPPAR